MTDLTDLADLSARDLVAGYRARTFSPVEVLDAVLRRIDAVEPTIHALYAFDPEAAQAASRASESRWHDAAPVGALDGVPITIKENIPTVGVPVPSGTAATDLMPAPADGPPAARVRGAGAVIVAKTTMPDYGMLSSGLSSFHDLARNPWNPDWNPGGSSAGAAAAAAAGYGPLHIGTDIGGSIRLPAGWTGLASLKPSFGRAAIAPPYYGRAVGPMTRTVADAALLTEVLAGPDDRDIFSLPHEDLDWGVAGASVDGLRVGLHPDAGCGLPVDPEVRDAVAAAAEVFAAAGAVVEPIEPFLTRTMLDDLNLFWQVRGWVDFSSLPEDRQAKVLPYIAEWCRMGAEVPGHRLMRCVNRMLEVGATTIAATGGYDLVVSPVAPVATYPAEHPAPTNDVHTTMDHIVFTVPYNFSHQPAATVNCGFTTDGRPIGLQIAARRLDDVGALRAASFYEANRPSPATPTWPPAALGLADGRSGADG
jgi:aspartyl-tRNA(Asn)/glutamyl-tRNA(Gln) amidotransferase subunit A